MRVKNLAFIVQVKDGRKIHSYTLRNYCEKMGIYYNTVLSRIHRALPTSEGGVIYFNENDPILQKNYQSKGVPAHGENAPKKATKIEDGQHVKDGDEEYEISIKKETDGNWFEDACGSEVEESESPCQSSYEV